MMKKRGTILFLLLLGPPLCGLFGQSNTLLDEFFSVPYAETEKAVYIVLTAADMIPEDATPSRAMAKLWETEWGRTFLNPYDPISLGAYAYLVMKIFEIPGGIMYTIIPSRRYAAREFSYRGFIGGSTSPYRSITPFEAMEGLNAAMAWKEARE